jgi:hypothetical protein
MVSRYRGHRSGCSNVDVLQNAEISMPIKASGAALFAAAIVAITAPTGPATAGQSFCPSPAHAKPQKTPPDLAGAAAQAFQIDNDAASATVVRCVGAKLIACSGGANLNCDKADARRALPGATAWCRENPGADGIPMAATGHSTIYNWSCAGRRAIAGKAVLAVDAQGYVADNWKEVSVP